MTYPTAASPRHNMSPSFDDVIRISYSVEVTTTSSFCANCSDNVTEWKVDIALSVADELFYMYYFGLLSLLTLINVIGNSVVISSILRHRQLRVPGNYFLFSIACSDLMLGLLYPIYNVSHIDLPDIQRVLGNWLLCTSTLTIYLGLQSISAFSLVGVAVSRFVSIRDPLKFRRIVTRPRVVNVVVLLWIGLLALSAALYFRTTSYSYNANGRVCRYEFVQRTTDLLITFVTSVFLPLLIMSVLYGFIVIEARKHVIAIASSRRSSTSVSNGQISARRYIIRKELRMVAMTGLLLGYFAFAWLPFVIYEFYTIRTCVSSANLEVCEPNRYVRATVRLLLHSNSAVNFFIYAARLRDFRDAMRKDVSVLITAARCKLLPCVYPRAGDVTVSTLSARRQRGLYEAREQLSDTAFSKDIVLETNFDTDRPVEAIGPATDSDDNCGLQQQQVKEVDSTTTTTVRKPTSVLYSLTMTLDRDESGKVCVIDVKTQNITENGSIITIY